MKTFLTSFRLLVALSLLTGLLYPLAVWAVGHVFFRQAAEGSLLHRGGQLVGSELLAQEFTDPRYFWPRPSAGDYATVPSSASNQAWTNARLAVAAADRRRTLGDAPDLQTASGSGLDPHLSPAAVRMQAGRVVRTRQLTAAQLVTLDELVARHTEGGQISPARINVLNLNLALDSAFPTP